MIIELPAGVRQIIDILEQAGHRAFAVGGCVRDSLMGKTPKDWDITTSAEPDQMELAFKKAGIKTIPTGIEHGTITALISGIPHEVTTFRIDGEYSDGRRPDRVMFTDDLREDLSRRDFTINAMAYSDREGLIDYFGGRLDIEAKLIRCVGEPSLRFSEDYLRMLRALRFVSSTDFEIVSDTWEALLANRHKITGISAERIQAEISRIIGGNSQWAMDLFFQSFGDILLPGASNIDIKKAPKEISVRLGLMLRDVNAVQILKGLKFDNETIKAVDMLAREGVNPFPNDLFGIKLLLYRLGPDYARLLMEYLRYLGDEPNNDLFATAISQPHSISQLKINGRDLMERGIKGPEVGLVLEAILIRVMELSELNDRETLLNMINP